MNLRHLAILGLCSATGAAHASCSLTAEAYPSGYWAAMDRVVKLPEYQAFLKVVKPGVKVIFGQHVDTQARFFRKCYWTVTVYSDESTHWNRWKTFYVPTEGGQVLVSDSQGKPIPLRSNSTAETDARKSSARGSP